MEEMIKEVEGYELPSRFQLRQVVRYTLGGQTATVRAVHFTLSKVKYDLELHLDDDTATRIYNVDSVFVETF